MQKLYFILFWGCSTYMSTLLDKNMRSIGGSFSEILALESSLFLFILFGAGLVCDVIKGTPCRIPIEIVQCYNFRVG